VNRRLSAGPARVPISPIFPARLPCGKPDITATGETGFAARVALSTLPPPVARIHVAGARSRRHFRAEKIRVR
jgi:hypothetical protein